jgi:hypothetical protein
MDDDTQKPSREAVDPASAGSARFGGFIGPPIDFREWWESKDHTYGGDATPMAIAGLAWEAAHRKYAPPLKAQNAEVSDRPS